MRVVRRFLSPRLQVLLAIAITLLVGHSSQASLRLSQDVVPVYQEIELRVDPDAREFRGWTRVELRVDRPVTEIQFHALDLTLDTLTLTTPGRAVSLEHSVAERGLVTATGFEPLEAGNAELVISFHGLFDTTALGMYRLDRDGQGYVLTQFEAEEARKAFPCWDQPIFKIPFQLTLTVPEKQLALSNTPITRESTSDGWKTVVFERTPPMPTYIVALAVGPFETVEIPNMPVPSRIVVCAGQTGMTAEAIRQSPPILKALEEYFGRPYPYRKLDLIAVPEYWYGAMENAGAITFRESILLKDPAQLTMSGRRSQASVLAHEFAHMWFGDLVTMEWWDDLWLNESFASWMGDKTVAEVFPEYRIDVSGVHGTNGAMTTDARPSTRVMRQAVDNTETLLQSADDLAYNKGQAVLEMIERWIGPEPFREGIRRYVREHEWGSVTAADLWGALSVASGSDLAPAMSTFLDQPGVPLVHAEILLDGRMRLTQKRFANFGIEHTELPMWQIPMVIKYADESGMKTQRVMLDTESQTVELPAEGPVRYLLPDHDAAGYYRWSVPPEMLVELAKNADAALTPRERVSFLGNVSALLDAGEIHGDDYLRVLGEFADDPEPQVVSTMMGGLSKVHAAFVPPEMEDQFAIYVRKTLGPALERFGMSRRDGEDEIVSTYRPQLIEWLADEGKDPVAEAYAESLAAVYFQSPESVDPALAGTVVGIAAGNGDRALFEEFKRRFEAAETPADRSLYLYSLGEFEDSALIEDALAYSLAGPLRPQEAMAIPGTLMDQPGQEDRIFRWMLDNFDAFTAKMPPQFRAFMPFIASGCSAERLAAAQEFFRRPEYNVPGTDKQLAKVADQVKDCVGLREREGEAVRRFLMQYAASE
ncbi:MAG: M1 family aminopeptidase [Candidatus Zixiibacteriota bacterium]